MSIFWKFFDSCAKKNKKITKLFFRFCHKKREHYAHKKNAPKKPHFFGRKNWHVILMLASFCFIWSKFDKTNENYLAKYHRTGDIQWRHKWCHWTSVPKYCIFCFILDKSNKTNMHPNHKHFCMCFYFRWYMVQNNKLKKRFKTLDEKYAMTIN